MAAANFPNSPTIDVTTYTIGDVTYIYRGSDKWEIVPPSITASGTTFTPAGNIAATNVQAAIEELDTEKQAALGFTPENVANKSTDTTFASPDNTNYPSTQAVATAVQNSKLTTISISGTDTYTGSLTPAITAYAKGQRFELTDVTANTVTSPTLNLNSLGAKNILDYKGAALTVGVFAGTIIVVYDGTAFRMIGGGGGGGGHEIQEEGAPLTQRANLNFVGATVTATDDAGNDATVITITDPSQVDNTAYDATSWDGVTTIAPSKNAVRDILEKMRPFQTNVWFNQVLTVDQDLFLYASSITQISKTAGVATASYQINAGSIVSITFTGDDWTGTIAVAANDRITWRITYTGGYTSANLSYLSNRT